jgi:hypothetical protein
MADTMIDFASLDSAATEVENTVDSTVNEPTVDSTVDNPVEDSTVPEPALNEDGTEQTPEQKIESDKTKAASDKAIDTATTPTDVRKALKTMRDADPKNAGVVKQLHGAFERWNAAKGIFPKGVAEMQEAKAFIEAVGGAEGYEKMQQALESVSATDELLYAADPKIWDNVIEDLKSTGHPEALGKLAPSFLSKLKAHDSAAYYDAFTPHFLDGIKEVGMDKFIANMNAAVNQKNDKGEVVPNIQALTSFLKQATEWYSDLEKTAKEKSATPTDTPERKKFLEEKAAFEKTRTDSASEDRKKFETGVAEECDKHNNRSLGKALGAFLKMPFFKDFPRETLVDLGNGIKDSLYAALKADKAYQIQMNAMWKQKTPDRAKMFQYHQAKVDSIATDIVTKKIQSRYPGYAKGGSAAGKAAAAVTKKDATVKAATQSVATGKPIYVASRPENLVREPISVGGREYSTSDLQTLQITGRGFVKSTDGKSFKFITWRK